MMDTNYTLGSLQRTLFGRNTLIDEVNSTKRTHNRLVSFKYALRELHIFISKLISNAPWTASQITKVITIFLIS